MTRADRERVHRAIAGAFARVDVLWRRDELVQTANDHRSSAWLRELLVAELAREEVLGIDAEAFENLVDAVRMSA